MKVNWFGRRRWERRMDAEFRFHLDCQVQEYISRGMSREGAEQRARREFGALELAKDECRDERKVEWLRVFLRDLRYAWRSLRKSPAFAAAAVLTIALGVGANTAVFSLVYAVLMKPLPYAAPDQIYSVGVMIPERRAQFESLPVAVQVYLEWRKAETAFAGMTVLRPWECNVTGGGEPERLGGARVATNFFSFLGVPPATGRGFLPEEEQPGRENVVVISDGLWRRRYGADSGLVGRNIDINGTSHRVVGIASPALLVPTGTMMNPALAFASRVDIWKPIAPTPAELRNESWDHGLLVRVEAGEAPERGRQQLQAILNRFLREQAPGLKTELLTQLTPMRDVYAGGVRWRLLLVLGAAAMLLLIACTNLASLFLARAASRAGEFATRIALGAGRARLLSQTLTETLLLALGGGGLSLWMAAYGGAWFAAHGPEDVRGLAATSISAPVFVFALAVSVLVGAVCGILPARQAHRRDVAAGLREAGRTGLAARQGVRLRQWLVGVQVALGTALLVCASLLLHSFVNVVSADRGYVVDRVLSVDLSLFGQKYAAGQARIAFYREVSSAVRAVPGVLAAGAISDLPAISVSSGANQTVFHPTDTDFQRAVLARPVAMIRSVTSGYFAASGSALEAGRLFQDNEPAPVALVSRSLAKRLWPGEASTAVVGRAIRQGNVTGPLITVAGVITDVRSGAADGEAAAMLYRPHAQWASGPATLVVRTAMEPSALAPAVRAAIRKVDADLPIPAIRTMREIVSAAVAQRRFQMLLIAMFAMVALLLGAVGVYGVVAYAVACRTKDIGLRLAMGATGADIRRWVLGYGMRPVVVGLAAGLAGALALASVMKSQLFGIAPADPVSFGTVAAVLLMTSGLACSAPARRASRVDPAVTLRHE